MAIFRTRSRMLYVRLSEEEYEELRRLAEAKRAHSTSELARQALSEYVMRETAANGLPLTAERLALLESEVRRMGRMLDSLKRASQPSGNWSGR